MMNFEKIKWKKCQPLLFRRPVSAPYFHSPSREGNLNLLPHFRKGRGVQIMEGTSI